MSSKRRVIKPGARTKFNHKSIQHIGNCCLHHNARPKYMHQLHQTFDYSFIFQIFWTINMSLLLEKVNGKINIYIPSSDILITLAKLLYNLKEVSWQTGVLNLRIPLNQKKRQNLNSQTQKQERKINTFPVQLRLENFPNFFVYL